MRNGKWIACLGLLGLCLLVSHVLAQAPDEGQIVVANRASGNLSIIDVATDQVTSISLPADPNKPEPMYPVYSAGRVLVGDRGNSRILALNAQNFQVEAAAPAGAGVWHMWADTLASQLWVANDVDKAVTVLHPRTLNLIRKVPVPADLAAQGAKPHDVILDPFRRAAYVTLTGVAGANDVVLKFSTDSFAETARASVGKDPHLSLTARHDVLYVPCQTGNGVWVLNRENLAEVARLPIPGAHGAGMTVDGETFYTTNLPGGGPNGLFTINTGTNTVLSPAQDAIRGVDTPFATPHNIALTPRGDKLYLTHSGDTADKVSIYTISPQTRIPTLAKNVTVGTNPFGIAFVP